ncbi:MAG: YciI family protein [Mesorhizobium sp.]|uniref:YciI family protein n=1 Tax=unclassified Mesorhizobium TaxID=325217 RepID=UPI000F76579E|nr:MULTISPECIES: YciI family protein [unclassified Mesorhizobium]AZO51332.1 YciI family protein [Mesorhizobium sp. M4B.F.Ca.ET.058.02.1.1]RUX43038.1 YciI family protein [Mesorhizobium sp. M4A.F.Ca.ET.050.02.1.1]RVC42265.1 YciI family protein [Mesorhizobium sp. M4A.F.Ca.ET.090.04.2.1]RVC80722.1 YciI family protein [Mesorhizobium sp. M4A.F.Ca.ET.022.05.2.1]RVD36974.1 YciI family protein [Mesorhizobium sp. M4A.F.Ca.ET.020.02.1.1]
MFYAILAYHVEQTVQSWTPEEDAALMDNLLEINDRLTREGKLGPAARLGATADAVTLRGPGDGMVIDGPFAETKEQLLGLYVLDCTSQDEAIATARDLKRVNPTAVYEIRPVMLYLPGAPLPGSAG